MKKLKVLVRTAPHVAADSAEPHNARVLECRDTAVLVVDDCQLFQASGGEGVRDAVYLIVDDLAE